MEITVRQLIEELQSCPPDSLVHFEGVTFYRVKGRGAKRTQIEFSEPIYKMDEDYVTFVRHAGARPRP